MIDTKFRAWDGKQMHYNIIPWQHDFVISLGWHRCEKSTGSGPLGNGGNTAEMLVPAIRFKEINQFIGLNDKDGKEIYEGDYVENGLSGIWLITPLENGAFGLLGVCDKYRDSNYDISFLNEYVKVIGNKFENKVETIIVIK